MPTDPHTPGRDNETVPPVDGEASSVPVTPSESPDPKKAIKSRTGPSRRRLLKLFGWGLAAAAASQLPSHGPRDQEQPRRAPDIVGGNPPEGAEDFRRHLRALEGMISGNDESAEFLIPELQADIHTYATLSNRIEMIERGMAGRLRERPRVHDAIRTAESTNDVILRLMVERLEQQRRMEIAGITRPHDADELRRLRRRNANLSALIKTEINSMQSLVRHVETLANLSRAIDNVPQIPGDNRDMENAFLRETYGRINNQVQERMGPALRVLWGQMPVLAKLNGLRSFITSANLVVRDSDLVARRNTLIPGLLAELEQFADVELPHPDGIRPGNGQDDRMTTELQRNAGEALRAFQRDPSRANKDLVIRAMDRLRNAVLRQTDKIDNSSEAWLEVQTISLTGLAFGGQTSDYRAIVHLDQPAAGVTITKGRLADITAIAARIERRRALHQVMRELLGKRNEEGFEQKFQALQSAYRQEMNIEISDMMRRVARNTQGAENALMGDSIMNYAGREAETVDPDQAAARTAEQRRNIASGQRGYSTALEERLLEHPEERAPLERCVQAWREDAFSPAAASFNALVAQLQRMNIPVPPKPAENRYFVYWLNRLLVHAGVAELHIPDVSDDQMRVLAMQQAEYATSMVRHAERWISITNPQELTSQEVLEEMMEMTLLSYSTQQINEDAQRQQRELPWLLRASYDTPVVNWMHKIAPSQLLFEATGGAAGWDLRDSYRNGSWLFGVQPPEYTVAALLSGDTEEQMNALGVSRAQFEAMTDAQRKAILDQIQDRKSRTVADVKQQHAVRIQPLANGVKNSAQTLLNALQTAGLKKPGDLVTERQYVTLPEEWQKRMGPLSASMAPSLVRGKLGHNPFKRLQIACERANVNLMEYKTVLRKPAGNWWGNDNTPDADRIIAAFNAGRAPRLTDEEWLWLYYHLLPGGRPIDGTPAQLVTIMQQCSREVEAEERTLAGMQNSTKDERWQQVQRVYRARGKLLGCYTQLSTQMRLRSDALVFAQNDYMVDQARSLGLHLNVAAVQYRLVDQNTSPLPMMIVRLLESAATVYGAYKLLVRLPGYAWRKWRKSVKFKRLATNSEKKLDPKYGSRLEELRTLADAAVKDRDKKDEKIKDVIQQFAAQLEEVDRQIAECNDIITRGAAEDTPASPATETTPVATEGAEAALPVAEEVPADSTTPEEPTKPKPTPGEVAIARTQLASLTLQREWLMKMLADMVPDDAGDDDNDEKTPPSATEATA